MIASSSEPAKRSLSIKVTKGALLQPSNRMPTEARPPSKNDAFKNGPRLGFPPAPNVKKEVVPKPQPYSPKNGIPIWQPATQPTNKIVVLGRSEVNCSVCNERMKQDTLTSIEGCRHSLHERCLLPYLQSKIADGITTITCPFEGCKSILREKYLRRILPDAVMNKYYSFVAYSFAQKKVLEKKWSQCPGKNCNEILNPTKQPGKFYCKQERKNFCSMCFGDYHPMFPTCEEYRRRMDPKANEKMLLKMIENQGWKQCPNCRLYV